MFNVSRFGFKFIETVANHEDIILFRKLKKTSSKSEEGFDDNVLGEIFNREEVLNVGHIQ